MAGNVVWYNISKVVRPYAAQPLILMSDKKSEMNPLLDVICKEAKLLSWRQQMKA